MARRRMIDPNFWASEDISKLNHSERLLFIGMFSIADDYGKGRGNLNYLRGIIFPYENLTVKMVENMILHISAYTSVVFYLVNECSYYKFTNWDKWQSVAHPTVSSIPEPDDEFMNHSRIIHEPISPKLKEVNIREVKVKEDKEIQEVIHESFSIELQNKFDEWLKYKTEKNQSYKPTGLKSLKAEIKNNADEFGEQAVIELINKSMAAGYTGITWDKLSESKSKNRPPGKTRFQDYEQRQPDAYGYFFSNGKKDGDKADG